MNSTMKSPAPAKKSSKPAATKKVAASAPAARVSAVATVAPVASATKVVTTTVTAEIDVGYGNAIYIRGSGAGLSWDRGLLMESVADNQWRVVLGDSPQPIVFKFLINDEAWCIGEDYTTPAGTNATIVPIF